MRFPTVFKRRLGDRPEGEQEELKVLGKDEPPEGKPSKVDNFHESKLVNLNGFPAQRVAVAVVGPKEARGRRLPAALYLHEDRTDAWLRVPGDRELEVGTVGYFDVPCLLDHGRARSEDESHNPGSLEVVLVVERPGAGSELSALPDGVYAFLVGTDVSNPGR